MRWFATLHGTDSHSAVFLRLISWTNKSTAKRTGNMIENSRLVKGAFIKYVRPVSRTLLQTHSGIGESVREVGQAPKRTYAVVWRVTKMSFLSMPESFNVT